MDKVHVIVNPFSAKGKTGQRWQTIKEAIRTYFKEFQYIFTEKPRQATQIARQLLHDGFDLIIGVGGDGTLNEISNGFFKDDAPETINDEASMGIIPSGTGSDFIRFMRIPRDFRKSAETIKNARKRKIDIGKITFPAGEQAGRPTYFINVADFGLGAEVIRTLSHSDPLKRGPFTYYKGLLKTIVNFRSKHIRLQIDGQKSLEGRYMIGAVANGRIFGGGMIIAPAAEPDDGYFDLVLVEDMKRMEIVANSRLLYAGTIDRHRKVSIIKARHIRVESYEDVHIEYDGEMGEALPAEFSVVPQAINFRV